ncbi:uncharacterized protein C10orf95 homolog [Pteronotus mesoamericanus]|uniref:uncharacterized protein C10orf95 homolog n=1 Tax=Pteronotus mesoamericanus TaxID=1884717 RepID=UPI0023ED17F1|nr:uncharacterized protein C10orf95 homolog [Pteronotus parnellii mesoamericanus]
MYSYSGLAPGESVWPPLQPLTYTYLSGPLLLSPVQTHNICSWPQALSTGDWTAPREYHCFHGPGAPLGAATPWWAFPQAYVATLRQPFPVLGYSGPSLQMPAEAGTPAPESWAQWPEGSSLQAQLRWGHVEHTLGPRLELPDVVRRELRRVYGTYPRTDVRVTFRGGEFLLQAVPLVREPHYSEQRPLQRPTASSSGSSGGGDRSLARETVERGSRKKRKGLG